MASGGPTKREIEASIRDFQTPEPMTIDVALASDHPALEIGRRLGVSPNQPMTAVEELYLAAFCFLGDSLNGGIDQALSNSTGDVFQSVVDFAESHCDPRILSILNRVSALFSDGIVPADRAARNEALDALPDEGEDSFSSINAEFYEVQDKYFDGLVAFATKFRREFKNLEYASKDA